MATKLGKMTKTNSNMSNDFSEGGYGKFLTQSPYYPSDVFEIEEPVKVRGNVPFLRDPDSGLIPYKAGAEILKSCDIMFPLRINLLGVRDIAKILSQEITNMSTKDGVKELNLISYIAPYEPDNKAIMAFLRECKALSPNNISI